jgi:ATP-binding cassette, subfamily C, bacterial CydCD
VKPFDPRLLRHARKTRVHIIVLVVLGAAAAGLLIAQAQLLAGAIAAAFTGRAGLAALRGGLVALGAVIAGRALVAWATEAASYRASAAVKSQLRRQLLARAVQLGPRWLAGDASAGSQPAGTSRAGTAGLAELATSGLDALDGYFAGYLPQLALAVIVPLAVLIRIGLADPLSAAVIAATLPLIPLFGALIGRAAGDRAQRRWLALARLAHHFADVVAGLPTLKVFGRARAQRDSIARVTDEYRRATLGTLRVAFLSSMVLELVATMSVALVATEIGLRLVYGHLDLRTGLLALILAPEAYLPLRQAGARFHASADGLAAAGEAFAVIETPAPVPSGMSEPEGRGAAWTDEQGAPATNEEGRRCLKSAPEASRKHSRPAPVPDAIQVEGIQVRHQGRPGAAPDDAWLSVARGEITALAGPSGSGKSTLIDVLLGFARPSAGRVMVEGPDGGADLAEIDPEAWRSAIAWVGQDPVLFAGTVESNIRLGWPAAPAEAVDAARRAAALDEIPLDKRVGERGSGLSSGQRRRVALARALLPPPDRRPVLLLDEPTAGLDAGTEARVIATLHGQAAAGRLVLVASHRPAVLAAADCVVRIGRPTSSEQADTTAGLTRPAVMTGADIGACA